MIDLIGYPFICWWTLGLFHLWGIVSIAVNIGVQILFFFILNIVWQWYQHEFITVSILLYISIKLEKNLVCTLTPIPATSSSRIYLTQSYKPDQGAKVSIHMRNQIPQSFPRNLKWHLICSIVYSACSPSDRKEGPSYGLVSHTSADLGHLKEKGLTVFL